MFARILIRGSAIIALAIGFGPLLQAAEPVASTARVELTVGDKVDFASQVEPLLSRFGCNAGGCHGKASGQNGFKLSLFGFDSEFDYEAIAQEARGRRIFGSAAENSLLLSKATGKVPHGGGKRVDPGTE